MKNHYLLAMIGSAALLLAASCSEKEAAVPESGKTWVAEVSVGMPGEDDATRVVFVGDRTFTWEAGDQIGIFTYPTTAEAEATYTPKFVPFTLASGEGTAAAKFTAELPEGVDFGYVAIYPCTDKSTFDMNTGVLTFNLPTVWSNSITDYGSKVRMPMAAELDMLGDKGSFDFKHVGGAVKVTLHDVPANTNCMSIWSSTKLSGLFTIAASSIGTGVLVEEGSDNRGTVQFNFPSGNCPSDLTVYFPVPCGSYRFGLSVFNTNDDYVLDHDMTASAQTVGRGTILQMPEITIETPVSTDPYIDLGLSVMWGSCNLLASSPADWGMQVKWGETTLSSGYEWSDYKWYASGSSWSDVTFTKYVGENGDNVYLELEDDAANANLHDKWRIPTVDECYELINNCTWTPATLDGQPGYRITSNIPGYTENAIFIPVWSRDYTTCYWTNMLSTDGRSTSGLTFNIYEQGYTYIAGIGDSGRCYPAPIRPVYDPNMAGSGDQTASYVDLGLPSGTLWATKNVNATSPEDVGEGFAWGETQRPVYSYQWEYYKWTASGTTEDDVTFSKYLYNDGRRVDLELADDAAHAILGGKWRMPNSDEMYELTNQAQWEMDQVGSVNGYRVTGPNGNSIFLPAQYSWSSGWSGEYWTGSLGMDSRSRDAFEVYFDYRGQVFFSTTARLSMLPIRPVYDPTLTESLNYGDEGGAGAIVPSDDIIYGGEF